MRHYLVLILLFIGIELQAQSALFLLISPVTTFNGMGEIGVGLPYEDQGAAYYNPANGFPDSPTLSASESKMSMNWLPGLVDDMILQHDHFRVSYRLRQYPLQFNFHQFETYLDAGIQQYTDANGQSMGTFRTWFKANAVVLAAKYSTNINDIPLEISYGISGKQVIQHLAGEDLDPDQYPGQAENTVYDRGLLMAVPFTLKLKNDLDLSLRPSFGMSRVNIGEFVVFNNDQQKDALPTTARVGIGLTATLPISENWNFLSYRAGNAAEDQLEKRRTSYDQPIEYQKGLGDINLMKHVFFSDPDQDPERGHAVTITRGHELTVLDFYTIRFGKHIDIAGKVMTPQSGISYHSRGILNMVYYITGLDILDAINRHIDISYDYADWSASPSHPLAGTKFESWNFTIKNVFGIDKSLTRSSGPPKLNLKELFTITLGANSPRPVERGSDTLMVWKGRTGYVAGIETDLKYFRLGLNLTEQLFSYDYSGLYGSSFLDGVRDEFYQLGLQVSLPFEIGSRLTVLGGVQFQSPLLHRKITVWDHTMDETSYEYNYGIKAGLEVKLTSHISARGGYSYWQRDLESYFNPGEKIKLASLQFEAMYKL